MFLDSLLYIGQLLHCIQIHGIIQFLKTFWFPIDSHGRKLCTNTPMEHALKMYMFVPFSFTVFPLSHVSYVNIACCSHIVCYFDAH
jgi:hypothetical protein